MRELTRNRIGRQSLPYKSSAIRLCRAGLAVDDDFRAAVETCNDQAILRRWLRQAATADSVTEILSFDGGS